MNIKRLLSLALTFVLLTSTALASEAYISRGEAADILLSVSDDYNVGLSRSDIIKCYDGELHEDSAVTRAEALVMLSRAFGKIPGAGWS